MTATKIHLNVPFAQKDEAKALGARWDAALKKWYITNDKDLNLFSKWSTSSIPNVKTNMKIATTEITTTPTKNNAGTITIAQHKDFIAYNGELPPWD
ncbi:MAG: DUF5710 domain-containing protein [Methylococcales bacterium]